MTETERRLTTCFSLVFPDLTPEEIPRATMTSVGGWDSVASINLVAVIEEEFGIEVDLEQLGEMASFLTIVDLLDDKDA